ncbi:MAG: DUF3194 domain-containing protein [Methanobrevibacter arboriphilus]|uniref:DUF3194 domain-containing protein n=1 Tax=Methanobrevibacter arboriphilus TaxID=39441 RepID=A0A843ADL4_METAZ|nr:DUF3194 domain-containing protein [Methanobrevibacter arboriphilus]MBF4469507.1 DUF3194 domain-containing protein [Methanobrevibacter arboriphilus]
MNKLKKLSQEDLDVISQYFSDKANEIILSKVPSKEVLDFDLQIDASYDDEELDINIDVDIALDELSKIKNDDIELAIEEAYNQLDIFIDENYRE